jgi:potassium-transporting ATPase KdpC subunit
MLLYFRPAITLFIVFTALTGLAYPLALTGIAKVIFPTEAAGSQISRDGKIVGSRLIGQTFASDRYFHGRPSAAGQSGYDASSSSGSNLGPLSRQLLERVRNDVAKLHKAGATDIPGDAVTASGSGLDPHISPAYAELQVGRVAAARGISSDRVRALIAQDTRQPTLGVVGEPRVNVLLLNLALDRTFGAGSG